LPQFLSPSGDHSDEVSWIDLFLAKTMPFVQEGKTDLGDSSFSPENGLPDPRIFSGCFLQEVGATKSLLGGAVHRQSLLNE
jgi:hypothetical protein